MKKVILVGTGTLATLVWKNLQHSHEYVVAAFSVNERYIESSHLYDTPIVSFENIQEQYSPEEYGVLCCIGYREMNTVRKRFYHEIKEKGYSLINYIHPSATVLTADIGEGNIIMENVTIGCDCKIGNGNIFYACAHAAHHTVMGDFNFVTISVAIAGNVQIGNNCFFGNNCTIKDNIIINDYSLIGAAAYISANTEKYSVYVPARSMRLEHKSSLDIDLIKHKE